MYNDMGLTYSIYLTIFIQMVAIRLNKTLLLTEIFLIETSSQLNITLD